VTVFGPRDRRARFEHAHPDIRSGLRGIAIEADRLAIEREFPGWKVSVREHDGHWHWEATRGAILWADDPDGLRTALSEFGA
jgi:hypothetical protein